MIEHVWTVLCSRAITDQVSNNVSLVEVLERLAGPAGPVGEAIIPVQAYLVTLWVRSPFEEPARGRARMRVLGPNGQQVGEALMYDVDLTEFPRLRNSIAFGGIPFGGNGVHSFVIEAEVDDQRWQEKAKIPLEVVTEQMGEAERIDAIGEHRPN